MPDPEDENWNPADERLEDNFRRKMMKWMDHMMASTERDLKRPATVASSPRTPVPGYAISGPAYLGGPTTQTTIRPGEILLRPVDNGFILKYFEFEPGEHGPACPDVPHAHGTGCLEREVFVKDAKDAASWMENAVGNARKIHDASA